MTNSLDDLRPDHEEDEEGGPVLPGNTLAWGATSTRRDGLIPVQAQTAIPPAKHPTTTGASGGFRPEFIVQAERLCLLLGATNKDLAQFFEVSESLIGSWMGSEPLFGEAVRRGKLVADGRVAESLYQQAIGGHTARKQKVMVHRTTGRVEIVTYEEEVPPNAAAAMFWLRCRQPAKWRERQIAEFPSLQTMTDDELEAIANGTDPRTTDRG